MVLTSITITKSVVIFAKINGKNIAFSSKEDAARHAAKTALSPALFSEAVDTLKCSGLEQSLNWYKPFSPIKYELF